MLEAITYADMLRDIADNRVKEDTIGILFTRPELAVGKDILSSLNYYHHLSGKNMNFYLPGYGAYWYGTYPDGRVVTMIQGADWSFSDQMFVRFVEDFEAHCSWEYSGESELLLIGYENGTLLFDQVLQFHLDNMLRDKVIPSTSSFFQQLFRICRDDKTLSKVRNRFGMEKAGQVTKELLLNRLPPEAKEIYTQGKYCCVKNCSKSHFSIAHRTRVCAAPGEKALGGPAEVCPEEAGPGRPS